MKIELHEIKVRDLVKGYKDSGDEGVVAYDGNLDVRPPYQRGHGSRFSTFAKFERIGVERLAGLRTERQEKQFLRLFVYGR